MKTLTNQTTALRLDFPRTWTPEGLSGLTIQIADFDGNVLLAADDVELYPGSTLALDALRYSRSITLVEPEEPEDPEEETPVVDLATGDLIRVTGVLGYEDHVVKGWDGTNFVAELEAFVDRDFAAGATVWRLHATADLDLSSTDDFPAGTQLVITWKPTGTGAPITELAEIEATLQIDVSAFTRDFAAQYRRAYDALTKPADRLDTVIRIAQDDLRMTLESRFLDVARIIDQRLLNPPLMALVALMWARDGDKNTVDEMLIYERAYSAALERLCSHPVWTDLDGDGTHNDGETESHPAIFERIW